MHTEPEQTATGDVLARCPLARCCLGQRAGDVDERLDAVASHDLDLHLVNNHAQECRILLCFITRGTRLDAESREVVH
jgi:hypothetical protein